MKKNQLLAPLYSKVYGVSYIPSTNRWRSYINEHHIGNFDTKAEAVSSRLTMEEIFKNILSKLDVDTFSFNRDNNTISIEVSTTTSEDMIIKTNILYQNSRKKSTGGAK